MKKLPFATTLLAFTLYTSQTYAQTYNFVVPRDGSFREALDAANNRTDTTQRYRIFVMQGEYVVPTRGTTTGGDGKEYGDPRCYLKAPNTSIIGENMEKTILVNTVPEPTWDNGFGRANPLEGIGRGDVLIIEKEAHNTYIQDITMRSGMGDKTGRNIVLHDRSDLTVCKNICIWGYQDTYVSNNQNGRFYFEGGVIRGRTDYICGKGDVLYNEVTFQQCEKGGYLAVPSVPRKYGYVMLNCYIKSETPDVTYYMGRPWGKGTPRAVWINTKVDASPITKDKNGYNGWADMSGGWPALFTEYNTTLTNGEKLDLSGRRTIFTDREGIHHSNAPFLSEKEAAVYTIDNVMQPSEAWNPVAIAKDADEVTNVKYAKGILTWTASPNASFYAVCKNGKVIGFTSGTSYKPKKVKKSDRLTVRSANAMGGLSKQ